MPEPTAVAYRCEECGAVHTTAEMKGDSAGAEIWSNWICPSCGNWAISLDDGWEKVDPSG
jgi:predicted RNA-binding Zn-ribbon protein involved in translation (DUF1610 family)